MPSSPAPNEPADPAEPARQSLSARAYDALRGRLRRGLVPPDARLVDLEIAAELGMSRMPVREALLQLVSEGYLVSTPRGYRLPTLSLQDFIDIFELRRLLEPRAAALAARDLDEAGRGLLDDALAAATQACAQQDFAAFFHAQVDFREVWLAQVHNPRLVAVIERCVDHVQAVRHTTLHDPAIQRVALERLQELHAGLVARDPIAAEDAMQRFLIAAEQSFIAKFRAADAQAAQDAAAATPARRRRR